MNPNFMEESFKKIVLENRETCHHWIDYEIYDALNAELQKKYVDQFDFPNLFVGLTESREDHVWCKANHKDRYEFCMKDCSSNYSKSLENIRIRFFKCAQSAK